MVKAQEKRSAPGAAARAAARGLSRGGGEVTSGPPEAFCVVGGPNDGDLSEAKIAALYAGNPWALEVIRALGDRHRASDPAPEFFWHRLRSGVNEPVRYVDLGKDKNDAIWLGIVDGRHRKDGVIKVNAERAMTDEPEPRALPSLLLPLPKGDPMRAAEIVRRFKIDGNIRVPMAPSHNADRVLELTLSGDSPYAAAVKIGVRAEIADREGKCLLALSGCCAEVQAAVDAGTVPLYDVEHWRKANGAMTKDDDEQRAWLAARTAPKSPRGQRKPRDTSAPKPLTPRAVGLWRVELNDARVSADLKCDARDLVGAIVGDKEALDALPDDVRGALTRALEANKPGRKASK